ncbi:hypothetical protein H310_04168, partial [Aphanomyces invadans]
MTESIATTVDVIMTDAVTCPHRLVLPSIAPALVHVIAPEEVAMILLEMTHFVVQTTDFMGLTTDEMVPKEMVFVIRNGTIAGIIHVMIVGISHGTIDGVLHLETTVGTMIAATTFVDHHRLVMTDETHGPLPPSHYAHPVEHCLRSEVGPAADLRSSAA